MQAAVILVIYAVLLVIAGVYAYASAPPEANAKTALIVPGVCAGIALVCAALTAERRRNRRLARGALYAAMAFLLLFTVAFAYTGAKRAAATAAYERVEGAYRTAAELDPALAEPAAREAYFRERGAPAHNPAYLRNTLWALTALSAAAFTVLLSLRRPLASTRASPEIPKVLQSEEHPVGTPSNPPPLPPEQRL